MGCFLFVILLLVIVVGGLGYLQFGEGYDILGAFGIYI
ncbi:hypothetical protein NOGI109294_14700 [Nocardiopsis gilva]